MLFTSNPILREAMIFVTTQYVSPSFIVKKYYYQIILTLTFLIQKWDIYTNHSIYGKQFHNVQFIVRIHEVGKQVCQVISDAYWPLMDMCITLSNQILSQLCMSMKSYFCEGWGEIFWLILYARRNMTYNHFYM